MNKKQIFNYKNAERNRRDCSMTLLQWKWREVIEFFS